MTKQEEIREGIARELARQDDELIWEHLKPEIQAVFFLEANQILSYLHSQGVVIKGKEHPRYIGYAATESLIGEG